MTGARTYLDYNASAPLRPEAREAMVAALGVVGNPSSVHAEGRGARALVETAREEVARVVNALPSEVVFTSGATEANASVLAAGWDAIAVHGTEHASVLEAARGSGCRLIMAPAGRALDPTAIDWLADGLERGRLLLSVQIANNETGLVNPVAPLFAAARDTVAARGPGWTVVCHSDAVQGLGRLPVDFRSIGADVMSLSSHKIGGPMGVGALVVRDGVELRPLIVGGGQERRRRAGTENVAALAGFGVAAAAAARDLADMARLAGLREKLETGVKRLTPAAVIVGAESERLANTSCIGLPGVKAETLLIKLDLAGIAVSAGAACSSGKTGVSHVLAAMGLAPELLGSALRISLGYASTESDVDAFLAAWSGLASRTELAA